MLKDRLQLPHPLRTQTPGKEVGSPTPICAAPCEGQGGEGGTRFLSSSTESRGETVGRDPKTSFYDRDTSRQMYHALPLETTPGGGQELGTNLYPETNKIKSSH